MKQKLIRRLLAFVLAAAMCLSLGGMEKNVASAASKKPKLNAKSISLKVGQSKKVKIKNKPSKAKVKWKSKNKKIATVKNGRITGKKAGTTKVTVKLTYKKGKKKLNKTLTVKVKVTKKKKQQVTEAPRNTVKPTAVPNVTPKPTATVVPTATPVPTLNPALLESNLGEEHSSANGIMTKDNGLMRKELTTQEHIQVMGLGWNVGNSLEQTGAGSCEVLSEEEQAELTPEDWVKGYETNAGNAVATQGLFDGLKLYGINTIRIPIAWSNMMEEEQQEDGSTFYKIHEAYFNRVEEVMNYALNNEMYVVINIHWDNQWWGMFGDKDTEVRNKAWKKYEDMWTQIAGRYKEYSDRLIFEGANEELGERLNDNWQGTEGEKGVLTQEETYKLTNEINQKFVDIVRSSGEDENGEKNNNYYRMLLIPGYDTNLHQTCGDKYSDKVKKNNDKLAYTMPVDKEENGISKLFVSIHYYDPLGWGIGKTAADGPYDTPKGESVFKDTWGNEADYEAMLEDFEAVGEAYTDKGYGVIFGEFGVTSTNKDGIPEYFTQFFRYCQEYGCVPVMWDGGGFVDRKGTDNSKKAYFLYEDIGQVFCDISGKEVELKPNAKKRLTQTGKPVSIVAENQDPLVVATWEGNFMRNTTASTSVDLANIRKVFGEEFIMPMNGNEVGAYFNTDKITYHKDYQDLTLDVSADPSRWHSQFRISDWSRLKNPCVRITMHDDIISKASQLQLIYTNSMWEDGGEYDWMYEKDYEQAVWEKGLDHNGKEINVPKVDENGELVLVDNPWQEKVLRINTKYLENEPVVMITTDNFLGADFVKVEFCDAAYNADGSEFVSTAEE